MLGPFAQPFTNPRRRTTPGRDAHHPQPASATASGRPDSRSPSAPPAPAHRPQPREPPTHANHPQWMTGHFARTTQPTDETTMDTTPSCGRPPSTGTGSGGPNCSCIDQGVPRRAQHPSRPLLTWPTSASYADDASASRSSTEPGSVGHRRVNVRSSCWTSFAIRAEPVSRAIRTQRSPSAAARSGSG